MNIKIKRLSLFYAIEISKQFIYFESIVNPGSLSEPTKRFNFLTRVLTVKSNKFLK